MWWRLRNPCLIGIRWMMWGVGFAGQERASVNVKQALAVITLLKEVASLGNKCQIRVGDSDQRRMHEGARDRVFKSLCCVVHYLVQDYCIGVHNGQFIVITCWCILDCLVQVQIREGSKKEKWIKCSSHCVVLCTIGFKIIALVCIMDCSRLLHGGAYWIVQWFVYGLFAVIAWKCTFEY